MTTDDILAAARKRLAEIEAEAAKLRAMLAAAEGPRAVVAPLVPTWPPNVTIGSAPPPPNEVRVVTLPYIQHHPNEPGALPLTWCETFTMLGADGLRIFNSDEIVIGGPSRLPGDIVFRA